MIIFGSKKMDPIIKLKLKEKEQRFIPVILFLKEPISNRLKNSISKKKGKIKYLYKHINAAAAHLDIAEIEKLLEMPEISFISYDRKAEICMDKAGGYVGIKYKNPYNLTGRNVNIAVIDTGVYPHGDLMRPYKVVAAFKDFVNSISEQYDDNGHGTHTCGIIAGSGSLSGGRYKGIAQNSRIIMLKAFNSIGYGFFSDIIAAIDWTIDNKEKYNIKLLCLPFGAETIVPYKVDPLCRACRIAWDSGIIVVSASGNMGPHMGSITTPGIEPGIITVGCFEAKDANIKNWKVADFSGRGGKAENTVKPEFIAPGVNITSLSSDKNYIPSNGRSNQKTLENPYSAMTGTSAAAAVATGCIALLLEKMPDLSGKDLKGMLKLTCQTLNEPKPSQGFGVINMEKLLSE